MPSHSFSKKSPAFFVLRDLNKHCSGCWLPFCEGKRSKTKVPSVEGGGGGIFLELNNGNFPFLVPGYMLGVFYFRIGKKEMLNALLSSAYTIDVDILSLNLGDL